METTVIKIDMVAIAYNEVNIQTSRTMIHMYEIHVPRKIHKLNHTPVNKRSTKTVCNLQKKL